MSESAVLYRAEAGVATLTLNRPEVLNALNDDLPWQGGPAPFKGR